MFMISSLVPKTPDQYLYLPLRYKNYEFISDQEISKSAGLNSRYSESSLHGVVFDIQMLSECDYLVCTFSSQVLEILPVYISGMLMIYVDF